MKNLKLVLFLFLGITLFFSCEKKEELILKLEEGDYLIFGQYYGFCQGEECIDIFKIEKDRLLEDSNDNYPNGEDFYEGNFNQELSVDLLSQVEILIEDFPQELLNETKKVLGTPDAADGGGLYIEYNIDGVRRFWQLDLQKTGDSKKYKTFIERVAAKIALIQE